MDGSYRRGVTGWPAQLSVLAEVALAMLLGGLIGVERELAQRPAGFRTHMLIAGAAALLVGLGQALVEQFQPLSVSLRSDPIRLVEAVVAAVGFIGAGAIFRNNGEKGGVEGLTTAASLLLAAAVGVGVAVRQFTLSVGVTVLALLVLFVLRALERWLARRAGERRS